MNDLDKKIESLYEKISEKKRKTVRNTRILAALYAFLFIFILADTLLVSHLIKKNVTPLNISALAKNKISETTPVLRESAEGILREQTPVMIEKAIDRVYSLLPGMENMATGFVDKKLADLKLRIKAEVLPEYKKVIRENAPAIKEYSEIIGDENAARELSKILVADFEKEIDLKLIEDDFYRQFHDLRLKLDRLATKPQSELTPKEKAQRKLIVGTIYLVDNGEPIHQTAVMMVQRFAFLLEDSWYKLSGTRSLNRELE